MSHYSRLKKCAGPDWGYRFRCRLQSCPFCRDSYIRRQIRQAKDRFGHCGNRELGMVSIVLGATADVNEIGAIMAKARRDLRNLVNRHRKANPEAWAGFEFLAWLETDCFDASQLGHLGSDKQTQYSSFLNIFDGMSGPVWVPTLHGIVKIGLDITLAEAKQAFDRQFKAYRQVDIRPLFDDTPVTMNIERIVHYANKHNDTVELYCCESDWDDEWIEQYYGWLHRWSRGSLRIKVSIKTSRSYKPYIIDEDGCIMSVDMQNTFTQKCF